MSHVLSEITPPTLFILLILLFIFSIPIHAATFTVTSLNDSGPGSLRQAVLDANASLTATHTINFQSGLTGTITLTTGEIEIKGRMTINGPGETVLAISGNKISRVFSVSSLAATISGLTIKEGNDGGGGGGISNSGYLTLSNLTLSGNDAGSGGGISNSGYLTLNEATLSNNKSGNGGGGISNSGSLTVTHSNFSGNDAAGFSSGDGGGIQSNSSQPLIISDSIFTANHASRYGGGINAGGGTLTVTNSVFTNNRGDATAEGGGGGIACGGTTTTITHSTFSGNETSRVGGGIYSLGILTVANSTLSGNAANSAGGGISQYYRDATIANSTITGNMAIKGGGGIEIGGGVIGGTVTLNNSIVSGNIALNGKEIYGAYSRESSYNLFGENGVSGVQGATPSPNEIIAGPLSSVIGSLANNGGPTQTHALVAGSPAIDKGNNSLIPTGVTTDQRGDGFPRIVGSAVDIGAVEGTGGGSISTYTLMVGKTGGNGTVTSNPNGINCGATCSANFNSGTSVTLTASADSGYSFTGWGGDCGGTSNTCTVPMDRAKSITAIFNSVSSPTYTLTVTKNGTGSGIVTATGINCGSDCTESYSSGTSITLTATAATGSTFTGWSPTTCAASFTMPAQALTCTATFNTSTGGNNNIVSLQASSPNVIGAGSGDDTYILNPSLLNSARTFTLTDTQGSNVIQLAEGLKIASSTLTSNALRLTLTNGARIDVYGANGFSYAVCGNAAAGLNPTPVSFATLATGTLGVAVPANASTIVNGGSVTVTCGASTYGLSVLKSGSGSGTVTSNPTGISCGTDCSETYASGTSVTLTAIPASGSTFAGWSGACTNSTGICTVSMSAAKSVTATFNQDGGSSENVYTRVTGPLPSDHTYQIVQIDGRTYGVEGPATLTGIQNTQPVSIVDTEGRLAYFGYTATGQTTLALSGKSTAIALAFMPFNLFPLTGEAAALILNELAGHPDIAVIGARIEAIVAKSGHFDIDQLTPDDWARIHGVSLTTASQASSRTATTSSLDSGLLPEYARFIQPQAAVDFIGPEAYADYLRVLDYGFQRESGNSVKGTLTFENRTYLTYFAYRFSPSAPQMRLFETVPGAMPDSTKATAENLVSEVASALIDLSMGRPARLTLTGAEPQQKEIEIPNIASVTEVVTLQLSPRIGKAPDGSDSYAPLMANLVRLGLVALGYVVPEESHSYQSGIMETFIQLQMDEFVQANRAEIDQAIADFNTEYLIEKAREFIAGQYTAEFRPNLGNAAKGAAKGIVGVMGKVYGTAHFVTQLLNYPTHEYSLRPTSIQVEGTRSTDYRSIEVRWATVFGDEPETYNVYLVNTSTNAQQKVSYSSGTRSHTFSNLDQNVEYCAHVNQGPVDNPQREVVEEGLNRVCFPTVPTLAMTATSAEVEEGGSITLTFALSHKLPKDTIVYYALSGSAQPSEDYTTAPASQYTAGKAVGTLTLPASTGKATLSIDTVDDTKVEGEEVFYAAMTTYVDMPYTFPRNSGDVRTSVPLPLTIIDNDVGDITVQFEQSSYSVTEGSSLQIKVVRSATNQEVSVDVVSQDGTATSPRDYSPVDNILWWTSTDTANVQSVTVSTVDNQQADGNRQFQLRLTNVSGSGAKLGGNAVASVTIIDNEGIVVTATAGPNGSITPASRTVSKGATTTFTVTPNSGYTATVAGCGGTLSGTTYTTGPITAACTVNATFSQSGGGGSGCVEGQIIKVNGVGRYRLVGSNCSIVADLVTGLDWQRCSVGQTWNLSTQTCDGAASGFSWQDAIVLTAPGGFRTPTLEELGSLVYCSNTDEIGMVESDYETGWLYCGGVYNGQWNYSYQQPTIVQEAFPNTKWWYWASSNSSNMHVSFEIGLVGREYIPGLNAVRLVRGGQ